MEGIGFLASNQHGMKTTYIMGMSPCAWEQDTGAMDPAEPIVAI